jgi:integrase
MPYEALPAFVERLRKRDAMGALALEFTILTAGRSGEVIGARWEEVDLDAGVWIIPAERMKAAREHRVPLAPRAVEILETVQPIGSQHLFPSRHGGRLSNMAMTALMRRMGVDVTVHGFRSTFRDWAAERTAYTQEVCEMALAHVISNRVEAAYRRGDLFEKRRRLMADWAVYCGSSEATSSPKL